MNYSIFKLKFKTALHIGQDSGGSSLESSQFVIHADTLFSALCHEGLVYNGVEGLNKIVSMFSEGRCLISDLFPYVDEELLLPKPILVVKREEQRGLTGERKKMKNIKYIPSSDFTNYLAYLTGKVDYTPVEHDYGINEVRSAVAIYNGGDSDTFRIGTFVFAENVGLYFIAGWHEEEDYQFLLKILKLLGKSGIGGKRSSGLGKFDVEEPISLDSPFTEGQKLINNMLNSYNAEWQMCLSVAIPSEDEKEAIEDSSYSLIRRGGFVQSENYSQTPLKKKVTYSFSPGSCFKKRFNGTILDVSNYGNHPVYRYGKPLFLGVDL